VHYSTSQSKESKYKENNIIAQFKTQPNLVTKSFVNMSVYLQMALAADGQPAEE
jgi:hypothetical protein